jgi:hypothetical protein
MRPNRRREINAKDRYLGTELITFSIRFIVRILPCFRETSGGLRAKSRCIQHCCNPNALRSHDLDLERPDIGIQPDLARLKHKLSELAHPSIVVSGSQSMTLSKGLRPRFCPVALATPRRLAPRPPISG